MLDVGMKMAGNLDGFSDELRKRMPTGWREKNIPDHELIIAAKVERRTKIMAIKEIGGFLVRSAALTLVVDGVRRLVRKIPLPTGVSSRLIYKDGQVEIEGDKITNRAAGEIKEVLDSRDLKRAEVILRKDGRVVFSGVPDALQQRIRNIMVNG